MTDDRSTRRIGVEALKALAHPLRVRLFSELSAYGSATATALAARLGESSGATSYHLRQLEKHGFVREDEARGTARDRWWERVPGPIEFGDTAFDAASGAREAVDLVETEFARLENERFATYLSAGPAVAEAWRRVAQSGAATLTLTPDELDELGRAVWDVVARFRGRAEDGERRRIDLQFRAFPVVGPEQPEAP